MKRTSHLWLRFGFALLVTFAAIALTFPRSVGLARTASLETISAGQGQLHEAPWPRSLRRAPKRTILPEEIPSLTENGRALGFPVTKRSAIEQFGAGRFRFTANKVQFSSSDGTSPLNNGRIYAVSTGSMRVREPLLLLFWAIAFSVWLSLLPPLGRASARATSRFLPLLRRAFDRVRRELYTPVPRDPTVITTPLLERFSRLLLPMPFFSGVVLGLLLCIAAGHLAARSNIYSDRSRFFFQISPEGYVYPTLENLLQFVRQKASPEKILVLAAGSSISLGVGQQNSHLWTDLLQRELGDAFVVVNGSFRSAKFTSIGLPLLEILSQEYPRFLFVTESRPGYAPQWLQYDSDSPFYYPYNYLLFQAWLSGKLLPNPERDQKLWRALSSSDEYVQLHAREDLIRAVLERATHASDLWNVLSYRFFFTVFSPVQWSDLPFWAPRKLLADDAWAFSFDREELNRDKMQQLIILKGAYVDKMESSANGEFKLSAGAWENFAAIEKAFPNRALRARTLFLVTPRNPYLTQELSPTEKRSYEASLRNWSATLNDAGFQAFPLGINYESEDFIDAHHFSDRAAPKMAADVAARVRRMAERNGWTNQAMQ